MKTPETIAIEKAIAKETSKMGVFGCREVTIGWYGKQRVDYMTYETKGVWRCFEIKVSKSDFRSKAHNTFIGHFNYYVMPHSLYVELKAEIPDHIGVYAFFGQGVSLVRRAKRQELGEDEQVLKNSLIRSLAREAQKLEKIENPDYVERMNRLLQSAEKSAREWKERYHRANNELYELKHDKKESLV